MFLNLNSDLDKIKEIFIKTEDICSITLHEIEDRRLYYRCTKNLDHVYSEMVIRSWTYDNIPLKCSVCSNEIDNKIYCNSDGLELFKK